MAPSEWERIEIPSKLQVSSLNMRPDAVRMGAIDTPPTFRNYRIFTVIKEEHILDEGWWQDLLVWTASLWLSHNALHLEGFISNYTSHWTWSWTRPPYKSFKWALNATASQTNPMLAVRNCPITNVILCSFAKYRDTHLLIRFIFQNFFDFGKDIRG